MKKALLLILFVHLTCFAQKESPNDLLAKNELTPLLEQFKAKQKELDDETAKLQTLTKNLEAAAPDQFKKTVKIKGELDAIHKQYLTVKNYYLLKDVTQATIDKYFPPVTYSELSELKTANESTEKKVYVLYGDKKVAEEDLFKNDPKIKAIVEDLLGENSEASLGDFEIPGDKQKIQLYDGDFEPVASMYVYFKEVKFSLRDGSIYDIRVTVIDPDTKIEYAFENKVPISMLNYMREAKRNFLSYRRSVPLDNELLTKDIIRKYLIRISDVIGYLPYPGNNYVPDDVEYTFPTGNETNTNESKRRVYKVVQDTNLKNVMELRTYTDFLGLFNDAPNGIVQIEGKADFYVVPFQIGRTAPMNIFKKISPYVQYARLDEDHRSLTLTETDPPSEVQTLDRPLEIIEKSYLDMGAVIDIFGISFLKESPFRLNLYYAMRYQIAAIDGDIANEEDDIENFKTFGQGLGLRAEFKRFNNFGFVYSPEFTSYNHINKMDFLVEPENFWVFRNEAEIFYYPGVSKQQSIFLRLRTFMNISDGEDSFFQLQFGYRFSIGLSDAKAKK
jgi:hypothetical protein